jgi:hypothetical protein
VGDGEGRGARGCLSRKWRKSPRKGAGKQERQEELALDRNKKEGRRKERG